MKYRAEIDGLRAIAVVPVVLFHAGFNAVSGGFLGVDVFFVISGYLITSIILSEMEAGQFSLLSFYDRRARRILPALSFVLLCSLPFAWFLLLPGDYREFSQSLIAVSTFLANIFFWQESGYFDTLAELKPLLHTWSLAVEEQYYILYPLFLMAAWRFGKRAIVWALVAAFILSLAMAQWGAYNKPMAAFFLLPTRAWELLIGCFAAFYLRNRQPPVSLAISNALSLVGLAAILWAVFAFNDAMPLPGLYSLVPTVGAGLIILFAVPRTVVHAVLSQRAFVGLGLISYSLYLWHQPVFVFWRHYNVFEPTPPQMGLLLLTCLVMAYLSFRFVEAPFRRGNWTNRRQTLIISVLTLGGFLIVGVGGNATHGFPGRVPEAAEQIQAFRPGDTSGCHNSLEASDIGQGARCVLGAPDVPPSVAFVGDSHTARITDALVEVLSPRNVSFVTFNGSWCAPLLNFTTNNIHKAGCVEEVRASFDQIIHDENIQTVVLFAEWAHYTHGFRWPDNVASVYQFSESGDFDFSSGKVSENATHVQRALVHTLELLTAAGKTVVMVLPTPEFEFSVPMLLSALVMRDAAFEDYYMSMDHYDQRSADVREMLIQAAQTYSATTVDPITVLCDADTCRLDDGQGNPLYEDSNHLSFYGALPLAKQIAAAIP